MQLVCEWFTASPTSVPAAFPGWLPPRDAPVHRQLTNPFTDELMFDLSGAPIMVDTFFPDGPFDSFECPTLSGFSPVNLWPVGSHEISYLRSPLGLDDSLAIRDALFVPRNTGWFLHTIPSELASKLSRIRDFEAVARAWRDELRQDESCWDDVAEAVDDWPATLRTIAKLSGVAQTSSMRVYVYQGCCVPT